MNKLHRISLALMTVVLFINAASFPIDIHWNRTEHNFGNIRQGAVVETSFTCFNGPDTLQIENVQASCGCVVPDWKRSSVMPGDSTVMKVVFDTKGKSGNHTKVITVYTNRGLYELIIKANILKD
jgi:hypothetical protein